MSSNELVSRLMTVLNAEADIKQVEKIGALADCLVQLLVLCFSLIVITLDNTILNVAIPTLAHPVSSGGLGASGTGLNVTVSLSGESSQLWATSGSTARAGSSMRPGFDLTSLEPTVLANG